MTLVLLALFLITLGLSFVVFFGPPFVPTMQKNREAALDLLNLTPGQTLLELGSGDGRVLLTAAKRGLNVVGIELSPLLVIISRLRTWRYRKQVRIIWGGYFSVSWPSADGIFTFMIPRQMAKLDQRISAWHKKPLRVASFAFAIPGKAPIKKQDGVFLYEYK